MRPRLTAAGRTAIDRLLTQHAASRTVPALHFGATTADGPLYLNCAGARIYDAPEHGLVDDNTVFQLYSATKLVTAVCALQLAERGVVDLDDPATVKKLLPELCAMPDLFLGYEGDEPRFRPRKGKFTLSNLLSHSSGISYPHMNPVLRRLAQQRARETGQPSVWSGTVEGLVYPPIFEPGTAWCYGLGIDWAGIAVERASNMHMEDYVQDYIFGPLGINDITFLPDDEALARQQPVFRRGDDGALRPTDFHVTPHALREANRKHPIGGGGLFGTQRGYLRFLQGVLASADTKRPAAERILSPASFARLFTNALPPEDTPGQTCYADIIPVASEMVSNDPAVGKAVRFAHSVGFPLSINDSPHGRRAGSGFWSGAGQTHYWIDPTTGIAGTCFTQLANSAPDPWFAVYNEFERTLYDGLDTSELHTHA